MKNKLTLLLLAMLISTAGVAQFYAGVSAGNAHVNKVLYDANDATHTLDKSSLSYHIFGGLGGKILGVEGGYRNLGKTKDTKSQPDLSSSISGWDVAARGRLAIGPVIGFAKAGAFFSKSENAVGNEVGNYKATTFMWGVGAALKLTVIGFRLEYENLDMRENSKISVISFGVTAHLGGK